MRAPPLSRRSFLARAIATGAIAELPFLGRPRPAKAAPSFNAVFVYVPDGIVPSLWFPTGTETSFTLPTMSDPLNAIKGDCVFLQGVGMFAGEPSHPGGTKKVLTATGAQSLDVFLGTSIKGSAPFDSLQLGTASNFENGSGTISYVGAGQQVTPDDNPLNVFNRVFAGYQPPAAGMTTVNTGPSLADRQKMSILDVISGDLSALQTKLGAAEKSRLDLHMQALRDIESRATALPPATMGAACDVASFNKVGFSVPAMSYDYPQVYDKVENFLTVGQLQMDLAVLALSCGMTHVVTHMWSHAVSPTIIPSLMTTLGNHDSSHYGTDPMSDNARQFVLYRRWFMDRLVSLVQALKNTPSPDGTVWDTTVLFLCSDIGDGSLHEQLSVPFIVAGGSKTGMRGGRYLNFTGKGQGGQNETHAKILVSLANAVGVPITSFGYTDMGTGPLPGLFG